MDDNLYKTVSFFKDIELQEMKKAEVLFFWLAEKFLNQPYTDIHFNVNKPPFGRVGGMVLPIIEEGVPTKINYNMGKAILYHLLTNRSGVIDEHDLSGEIFSANFIKNRAGNFACYYTSEKSKDTVRFRVNAHFDQFGIGLSLRVLPDGIPPLDILGFSDEIRARIQKRATAKNGLIVLVGPVNSGKSTTLASVIDYGNKRQIRKVLTLESPIEYVYPVFDADNPVVTQENRALVIQREIGLDCASFTDGLKEALRQDAQAILVGELLSEEECHMALMAALTGHLVFCTVHATSATDCLNRLASFFPPAKRPSEVATLSTVLGCVIFQMLLPTVHVKEAAQKSMNESGGLITAGDIERQHSAKQKAEEADNSASRMASRCLAYEYLDGTKDVKRCIGMWAENGDSKALINIETEMKTNNKGHSPFLRSLDGLMDEGIIDQITYKFALESFEGSASKG
jgi:Tfp pilus assembly pilus retraction ATPase PilT